MKPPVFFSRCENDDAFLRPVAGIPMVKQNIPLYGASRFGNGFNAVIGVRTAAWKFNPANYWANNQAGSMEIWYIPSIGFDGIDHLLHSIDTGVNGTPFTRVGLLGGGTNLNFSHTIRGGASFFNFNYASSNFTAGVAYHIVLAWDAAGFEGGANTNRAIVNGVIVGSSNTAMASTGQGSEGNSTIGNNRGFGVGHIGSIDNIKFYDYGRVDLTDRFNERGGLNDQVLVA